MSNYFEALSGIDVNKHIEKKGGFSYLSWPFAVSELRKRHPTASWEVVRFDGKPFLQTENGCFVEVAVTVEGVKLSQIHPVLDGRNKTIPIPNAFDINTSLQRALVKAIALHGLGLYIYAGEDIPAEVKTRSISPGDGSLDALSPEDQEKAKEAAAEIVELWTQDKEFAAYERYYQQGYDNAMMLGIWEVLRPNSEIRNKLKAINKANEKKAA